MTGKNNLSDPHWKEKLTPEQYEICRNKGTEAPFSGEYLNTKTTGTYHCFCCGNALFHSEKNLILVLAGQVSVILLMLRVSTPKKI